VDAERPDNSRIITIIAGPEEAKIQLPRILICTMSPIIADMLQKALKQQKKKIGALEHVPRFEGGLALLDDENTLDFASHGQARTPKSYPLSAGRKSSGHQRPSLLALKSKSLYAIRQGTSTDAPVRLCREAQRQLLVWSCNAEGFWHPFPQHMLP
jgi:hypothetical protein